MIGTPIDNMTKVLKFTHVVRQTWVFCVWALWGLFYKMVLCKINQGYYVIISDFIDYMFINL